MGMSDNLITLIFINMSFVLPYVIWLLQAYFKTIPENTLTDERFVGRKKLPTTLIGLLFHAAEHSQRHVGQLLVTVSVVKGQ